MIDNEIYTPWRIAQRSVDKPVAGLPIRIVDANENTMAYADDEYFIKTAVRAINSHAALLDICIRVAYCLDNGIDVGPGTRAQLRSAITEALAHA